MHHLFQHDNPISLYLRDQVRQAKLPAGIANNALAALAARDAGRAIPDFSGR